MYYMYIFYFGPHGLEFGGLTVNLSLKYTVFFLNTCLRFKVL